MQVNPWHKVDIGAGSPDVVEAIIETPKFSKAKYELHKASGMLAKTNLNKAIADYKAAFPQHTLSNAH